MSCPVVWRVDSETMPEGIATVTSILLTPRTMYECVQWAWKALTPVC